MQYMKIMLFVGSLCPNFAFAQETHKSLVEKWDDYAFKRGQKLYAARCVSCHGTKEKVGALPQAMRFSQGRFKNGKDPYSMYQTIRKGYNILMPAHPDLSHEQIYDVIHYIREQYLTDNKNEFFKITPDYLNTLPKEKLKWGKTTVPQFHKMHYGPTLSASYKIHKKYSVTKGIAIDLKGHAKGITKSDSWMLFDQDTLQMAAGWKGQFSDYNTISMEGFSGHQTIKNVQFSLPNQPAWADVKTGKFIDTRIESRTKSKLRYGPQLYEQGRFEGIYYQGSEVIIRYRVGRRTVLEKPSEPYPGVYRRDLQISAGSHGLRHLVASNDMKVEMTASAGVKILRSSKGVILEIPKGTSHVSVFILTGEASAKQLDKKIKQLPNFTSWLNPGANPYSASVKTELKVHADTAPFVADIITLPQENPWDSWMRLSGIDFFSDSDKAAVCTFDGDVWVVSGFLKGTELTWRRYATGLFQPLGLKIIRDKVYVTCRDQIALLHDANNDYFAEYVQAFNSDHQVTPHFHEFAMDLEVDKEGYLYYLKGACHAANATVPQHGTLIQVTPDGKTSEIVATGFRAPNGMSLNKDGSFYVGDQEGHWIPVNRINHVIPSASKPKYYGYHLAYHGLGDAGKLDSSVERPVIWTNKAMDRSPADIIKVNSSKWGALNQQYIGLSYGYGKMYLLGHKSQSKDGFITEIPLQCEQKSFLPTGVMRGRFNPRDEQLYACGLSIWATSRVAQKGGLYRIRHTKKPYCIPTKVQVYENGIHLTLSDVIKPLTKEKVNIRLIHPKRGAYYGVAGGRQQTVDSIKATHINWFDNGKELFISCDGLKPARIMQLDFDAIDQRGDKRRILLQKTLYSMMPKNQLDGQTPATLRR